MADFSFDREKKLMESYAKQELEIDSKLQQLYSRHHSIAYERRKIVSCSEQDKFSYRKRNELFLKSLEMATAKLRTKYCFRPTDKCLENAKRKYIETLQRNAERKEVYL